AGIPVKFRFIHACAQLISSVSICVSSRSRFCAELPISMFVTLASEILRAVLFAFTSRLTENTPRCCSVYKIPPSVSSPLEVCPGGAGVKSQLISAAGSSGLVVTVNVAWPAVGCAMLKVTLDAMVPVYCKLSKAWHGTGNGPLTPQLAAGGSQYSCDIECVLTSNPALIHP